MRNGNGRTGTAGTWELARTRFVPNETTRAALDDACAGRLRQYQTVEALFEHINAEDD